jgi:hypothetical protein
MKVRIITMVVFSLFMIIPVSGQGTGKKNNPSGTWKFDAPTASYGYTSGNIVVTLKEQKYNCLISFTGNDLKLPCENVKLDGENFSFSAYVDGQEVKVLLKMENNSKMSGNAESQEGGVPLTLTREPEKK